MAFCRALFVDRTIRVDACSHLAIDVNEMQIICELCLLILWKKTLLYSALWADTQGLFVCR